MAFGQQRLQSMAAMAAATHVHAQLGLDRSKPIDVFEAIRSLGIWLVFQRLDNLLGATVRQGAGGIIITTERPLNLQRYTAAHELGHYVLHDDVYTWDTDETVLRGDTSAREQAAQVFAGAFLMPRQLVTGTLRRLGVGRGDYIAPMVVYKAATIMGVSYEAALQQLKSMNMLTMRQYLAHKEIKPMTIKTELSGGIRPKNPQANVWSPSPEDLQALNVAIGDEVVIDMPENRTTGYRWTLPSQLSIGTASLPEDGAAKLELVSDNFQLPETPASPGRAIGGGGRRRLVLRANAPGQVAVPLALRRSFEAEAPPAELITLSGKVQMDPAREQARLIAGLGPHGGGKDGADA